jgi:formylglycine-generating enzyme required for sulfatase activity
MSDAFTVPPLVRIEAASFLMGSQSDNECPVHRVDLDAFAIGLYQVSNAEYDSFVQCTGRSPLPHREEAQFDDPRQPAVAVSWFDAMSYCEWLSSETGQRFRLPTEAEWECAARGGVAGALYPWGDDPPQSRLDDHTRWIDGPEARGGGAPNGYGLYDICENVHEWCSDWYAPDYYAVSPQRNPRGPETGVRRVSRGGSWRHHVKVTRCAARSSLLPDLRYTDYGFRVASDA